VKSRATHLETLHGLFILLCVLAVVAWAPVPLGSNRPVAWFALTTAIYGILALWAVGRLAFGSQNGQSTRFRKILVVLLIWLGGILLQTVDPPSVVPALLAPFVFGNHSDLLLLNISPRYSLSVDAGVTFNEFLKYGAYVALFFLTYVSITNRNRLIFFVVCLVAVGVAESVYGLYVNSTGFVIFPELAPDTKLREGTFVNRNHFANYVAMLLCLALGLLTWAFDNKGKKPLYGAYKRTDLDIAVMFVVMTFVLILVAGVLASGSRGAIVFLFFSVLIMILIERLTRNSITKQLALGVIVTGAASVSLLTGTNQSIIRLLERDIFGGERLVQNMQGLRMLQEVWPTGVGAGNYRWTFQMFRDQEMRFATYDHAHNDYLESMIEQGLPLVLILGVAVYFIYRELYRGYKNRRNNLIRGVIFGCLLSITYMLLHSLVEFNFRIPANAVLFFVIAGLGVRACHLGRTRKTSRAVSE